jgi:anti-anti-sigma regulatory factor
MATNAVWVKVDGERVVPALQEAREKLDSVPGELVLDFSSVHRVAPGALRAMEELADAVDGKGTKVVLRGVNIDIYKVLKLMKLSPRFAFRT